MSRATEERAPGRGMVRMIPVTLTFGYSACWIPAQVSAPPIKWKVSNIHQTVMSLFQSSIYLFLFCALLSPCLDPQNKLREILKIQFESISKNEAF